MVRMEGKLFGKAKVTVKALTPLLVGGREPDRFVHLSSSADESRFIIPSSAIKGAIVERIKSVGASDFLDDLGEGEREGTVKFSEMKATSGGKNYDERTRVSINPKTRTAEAGHLFLLAAAPKGLKFVGDILFKREISTEEYRRFTKLLTGFPIHIGGGQTSGFGRIQIEFGSLEKVPSHTLQKGLWQINLKPLSPYSSKPVSGRMEKSYFVPSKEVIESLAIKKVFGVQRSGWFFPSKASPKQGFPVPFTFYKEKNEEDDHPIDLIKEFLYSRITGIPFLLANKATDSRLVPMKGYINLTGNREKIKVTPITSYHVKRNLKTRTVEDFWVQVGYRPEYYSGIVRADDDSLEIPQLVQLGGSRGKGYGLFEVEKAESYKRWETWGSTIKACSEFIAGEIPNQSVHNGLWIPILITSPTVPDSAFIRNYAIVHEFSKSCVVRKFVPETGKTHLVSAVSPGSVWLLLPKEQNSPLERVVENLKDLKNSGIGAYTEDGFGDFEIYPWG